MQLSLEKFNSVLEDPSENNIFDLFHRDGYIRFNMLYASPIALKHLHAKLQQYDLRRWFCREEEMVFELANTTIIFRGSLVSTGGKKLFCLEFDFDPVIPDDAGLEFLYDIETFLKKCDTVFFMTYFICIDSEILSKPISMSFDYLVSRK